MRHLLCLLIPVLLGATEPSGYRGPHRDGIQPATGLLKTWPEGGPKEAWRYTGCGEGYASPAVADGVAWSIGKENDGEKRIGRLVAVHLADGKERWKVDYGPEVGTGRFEGPRSSVEYADGKLVFASGLGVVHCRNAVDGASIWSCDVPATFGGKLYGWGYCQTPLIAGDRVILGACATTTEVPAVVALDLATGKQVWKAETKAACYSQGYSSAIAVDRGGTPLVIHQQDTLLMALDRRTGAELWRLETAGGTMITPVHRDGLVLVGASAKGGLHQMLKLSEDGKSQQKLWEISLNAYGQAVLLDGRVYAFGTALAADGKHGPAWLCLDAATGKVLANRPAGEAASVIAADGLLYWLEGGEKAWKTPRLSLVRPTATGMEMVSTFSPAVGRKELFAPPVISAGRLLIRHGSLLVAYDITG